MKKSIVVTVHGKAVFTSGGGIDTRKLERMFRQGFSLLTGSDRTKQAVLDLFPFPRSVGIKINTLGGRRISTRPDVSLTLAHLLKEAGPGDRDIIIWDRTNRELREAGYRLHRTKGGIQVFGSDTRDVGYGRELISQGNVGSLFSSIQKDLIHTSISLAVLKDHGLAGVTAGMKNYFGAIHNPNKYHDTGCNPYVAEVFATPPIKSKHRLSILDALIVQYHRGPSYHEAWADPQGILVFSLDPVACDLAGWQIIERLRKKAGLPTLREEGREPVYLKTAERMGLGTATPEEIETIEVEV